MREEKTECFRRFLALDVYKPTRITVNLYPYSRFVCESVIDFIVGDNVFWVNAFMILTVKFVTIALCWSLAIFIAPVGLACLYFYHSRQAQQSSG
jgi:hypothetical protein